MLKLKEHERATFFSPSENRCLPTSTLKLEEREFVVDSGASMHMISKKDLSDAEMDTLNGYSCEWMNNQKTTSHLKRDSDTMTHGELRSYCGSRLVSKFVFRI